MSVMRSCSNGLCSTIQIRLRYQKTPKTVPNTLCKKVRDISICSDCVSYRHCEAVHQWILRGTAQYNAELTKQASEATYKDFNDILKRASRRREIDKIKGEADGK